MVLFICTSIFKWSVYRMYLPDWLEKVHVDVLMLHLT